MLFRGVRREIANRLDGVGGGGGDRIEIEEITEVIEGGG